MCLLGSIVDLVMSSMKPHSVLSDLWRNSGKEDVEDRKKHGGAVGGLTFETMK